MTKPHCKLSNVLYVLNEDQYCGWGRYWNCYQKGEWFKCTDLPYGFFEGCKTEPLTEEEKEIVGETML